ncbi:MAG: hypothetical protein KY459_00925 [Acidobacteria bacterium]|nr:hypothetical protein [Acidobacteriota bacterium]
MTVLLLIAGTVFPSGTLTSWMEPAAFRLSLNDDRAEVEELFEARGWELVPGKGRGQLVHQYDDARTVTLGFSDERLTSIRFELSAFAPDALKAYEERRKRLEKLYGRASSLGSVGEEFSTSDMRVHLIIVDGGAESGGASTVVVRYFVPEAV